MGDAFLVRVVECGANLHRVLQCLIDRQGSLEGRPLDVLHHQVVGTNIVQRTDVRMIQRANGFSFTLESLAELRGGNLDRDITTDAGIARFPHLSHSTLADGREDFVRAEFVAGLERHLFVRAKFS